MKLSEYRDDMIVERKGHTYGTYKTFELLPKGKGAQMVKVLHSSSSYEKDCNFAIIRVVRLVDLKEVK